MSVEPRVAVLVDRWVDLRDNGSPVTIEELCTEEPQLASEVRRRIEALQAMRSFLETDVSDPRPTSEDSGHNGRGTVRSLPEFWQATAVYRRECHYDQGGLADIFTARQEELGRVVALKRIRTVKLHGAARQRFLREAAITAQLQHPGIVPIYGLGQDDHGPFYTMPLIQGQTLQQEIEEFHELAALRRDPGLRSLKFRGFLQQFITVCNTMAYAHAQGFVHRDLKPSNIMIGRFGETVVMDWGLAKRFGSDEAVSEERGNAPLPSPSSDDVTATGQILGTPQYMSPEQAKNEPVGPAADVFNLGLVLYAILTGKPAFEESRFRDADWLKVVREAAIVPPRSRDAGLPRALEAICLKALAVQPDDRYQTAGALADEVTRWLADEPVIAWREPVSIRLRRWGRRHRTAVAAAVVAVAAGVIGLGAVTVVQARVNHQLKTATAETQAALERSEESRKQADAIRDLLVEAFQKPDPSKDGRDVKLVDLLDQTSKKLFDGGPSYSPATEGMMLGTLGQLYFNLGLFAEAMRMHSKAREVREAALGPDHPATLSSCNNLAGTYARLGRLSDAIDLREKTLALSQAKLGPDHLQTLASRINLASDYAIAGQLPKAIELFEAALRQCERTLGPDHATTHTCRNNLASAYRDAGRLPDAIALNEKTHRFLVDRLGPDNPLTLGSGHNLAVFYADTDRLSEAIHLFESTLARSRAKLGAGHLNTLRAGNGLANAYHAAGRLSEAIALHQEILELEESNLAIDHPETLLTRNGLAGDYVIAGRLSEAIALFERNAEPLKRKLGPDHTFTLTCQGGFATAYESLGQFSEAERMRRDVLARRRKTVGPDSPLLAGDLSLLAQNLSAQSRWSEAEPLLRECLEVRDKVNPDDWRRYDAMSLLGLALLGQARFDEAEPLIVQGYEGMQARKTRISVPEQSPISEAALRVVHLYENWGRPGKANEWKAKVGMPDLPKDVFLPQ